MHYSNILRSVHKPLIRFVGPRVNIWKESTHQVGPHPLTPPNLVKHIPQPTAPVKAAGNKNTNSIEFSQLSARYRRAPINEIEMEAIESGGATHIF
ncbi:hypothetical protein BDB01DRAFT_795205 [Pilobolus umbonatus]|nr:hypothetical protein BDB01DRAFT_795205 [Pilobolus umbonatus]